MVRFLWVGRGDIDAVEILVLAIEHLAPILVHFHLRKRFLQLGNPRRIQFRDADELEVRVILEAMEIRQRHAPAAKTGMPHHSARRRRKQAAGDERRDRAGGSELLEEGTTGVEGGVVHGEVRREVGESIPQPEVR